MHARSLQIFCRYQSEVIFCTIHHTISELSQNYSNYIKYIHNSYRTSLKSSHPLKSASWFILRDRMQK